MYSRVMMLLATSVSVLVCVAALLGVLRVLKLVDDALMWESMFQMAFIVGLGFLASVVIIGVSQRVGTSSEK